VGDRLQSAPDVTAMSRSGGVRSLVGFVCRTHCGPPDLAGRKMSLTRTSQTSIMTDSSASGSMFARLLEQQLTALERLYEASESWKRHSRTLPGNVCSQE
jgi:hypothetical protein